MWLMSGRGVTAFITMPSPGPGERATPPARTYLHSQSGVPIGTLRRTRIVEAVPDRDRDFHRDVAVMVALALLLAR